MKGAVSNRGDLLGQVSRYAVTGAANTCLGFTIIVLLHKVVGIGLVAANLAGFAAGFALSFLLNRRWTFGWNGSTRAVLPRFAALVLVAFLLNLAITAGLEQQGLPYGAAQACGVIFYSVFMFIGLRHVVFADHA
ncbi:hypothetical protein GVY41_12945 [Frigidibacter albus]|uniref:GtrA/DPMS transmembrane domain-containing protein n=1 Tax=Frigidibacter albus TaxID=1465486 RepID=A0A6L8VIR1_9RHOB|nr:GtrA family protein [Frigidibacter albus]MZQ89994.1 hypothetical protein [Frigidibacter albus]NBE31902.1 hypothetical protein [Frigidibacter albus]GGH57932.1 hypothetical protein GCM10011341_27830 [Frigidibacter albus]